ncbi:hypothetical protein [Burkholderia cepacia]|nr:hypothetical protein [Burkholderia cepacia]
MTEPTENPALIAAQEAQKRSMRLLMQGEAFDLKPVQARVRRTRWSLH